MESFRSSRVYGFCTSWVNLIFPKIIEVHVNKVYTKWHRSLILFWITDEETVQKSRIASVQHKKGFFWDKVLIETTGGTNYIDIKGLNKQIAKDLVTAISKLTEE